MNVVLPEFPGQSSARSAAAAALNYLTYLTALDAGQTELNRSWSAVISHVDRVALIEDVIAAIEGLGRFGAEPFQDYLARLRSAAVGTHQSALPIGQGLCNLAQTAEIASFSHGDHGFEPEYVSIANA